MYQLTKSFLCLTVALVISLPLSAAEKDQPKKPQKKSSATKKTSAQKPDPKQAITNLKDAGSDFTYVGEYVGEITTACYQQRIALQVYALGGGKFAARQYPDGLPGECLSPNCCPTNCCRPSCCTACCCFACCCTTCSFLESEAVVNGQVQGGTVVLANSSGRYVIGKDGQVDVQNSSGKSCGSLKKVQRGSSTMGGRPDWGAEVLFRDGYTYGLKNSKMTSDDLLMVGFETTKGYQDFKLHVEFRLPYMPYTRGQGRANSGVYLQSRYEVQILDSFGLEGKDNECGGFYKLYDPNVNMCLPPLTWQTYDIEFRAARFDNNGIKVCNARATVMHNGVVIHDDVELTKKTGGGAKESSKPLPIKFQNHGNPVHFRNIWVVDYSRKYLRQNRYASN